MPAAIRKVAVVLAAPALAGVFAGTAAADPKIEAPEGADYAEANPADFASCPAGAVCYYSGHNGTGAMCAWQGADRQHADECRWMGEGPARSIFNNGRDPAFAGVCSYRLPDYGGHWLYQAQGVAVNLFPPGNDPNFWKRLSHRWTRVAGAC